MDDKIVIVGAGCFGVSAAFHLLKRGYTNVIILDRSPTLPAVDAASNDINRIVRSSYSDKFYAELGRDATLLWRNREEWGDSYHESGVLTYGLIGSDGGNYTEASYLNDTTLGANAEAIRNFDALRSILTPQVPPDFLDNRFVYINRDNGWANAGQGLSLMISKVKSLKGKVLPNKQVVKIIREDDKTKGVQCSDGEIFLGNTIILATGSWTASSFPELYLESKCLATGQCIAMIQLSTEEAELYKSCPVLLDFSSGFYIFPPNENNIIKMAIHSAGYTNKSNGNISVPITASSDPARGLLIPKAAVKELRGQLRKVYPNLALKPFSATRLCWYTDSPDGDWIISRHPDDESLVFATSGSGHAYKFLPVIGRIVADLVQGRLDANLVSKFSLNRTPICPDKSRSGKTSELELDLLCTPEDLLPF